jgi:hypothetical protein
MQHVAEVSARRTPNRFLKSALSALATASLGAFALGLMGAPPASAADEPTATATCMTQRASVQTRIIPQGEYVAYMIHLFQWQGTRWVEVNRDSSWRWFATADSVFDAGQRAGEDWTLAPGRYYTFGVDQYFFRNGVLQGHVYDRAYDNLGVTWNVSDAVLHNSVTGPAGYCYSG